MSKPPLSDLQLRRLDGINDYGSNVDGTHNSTTGNTNIATQITHQVLVNSKVILS